MREQREQRGLFVHGGERGKVERRGLRARLPFARVKRRVVGEFRGGDFHGELAVIEHAHHAVVLHHADFRVGQVPLFKDVHHGLLVALLHDDEHALLRFAQQRLVGRHARLALRHFREVNLHARAAAARRLARRAREARRAHVLDARHRVGREQFEARLHQQLLAERIAHLHRGPVLLALLREIARCERRAREPVAPRLRADVENRIAHALRRAARDLLVPQNAEAEHIHQRVAIVALVEKHLAADGRHADAIPVVRDAAHHARKTRAVPLVLLGVAVDRPEAQRVQREHRPRAHRENVADDPAHARRRALERLDGARVIVRLHLERHRPPVADVDDARIFLARLHEHERPRRREFPQLALGVLIRAVLAPHHREHAQLRDVRIAPEDALDAGVFLVGEAVLCDEFLGDDGCGHGVEKGATFGKSARTCKADVLHIPIVLFALH